MDLADRLRVMAEGEEWPHDEILIQASERLSSALEDLELMKLRCKHPQDMSLRELFDHVAIVNDAVRAALAGHPGCEPVRREVEHEWSGMETAPLDGITIIVRNPKHVPVRAFWDNSGTRYRGWRMSGTLQQLGMVPTEWRPQS